MTSWSQIGGSPQPLGAVWLGEERSYNFALYSRHATGVTLLLYTTHDLVNPVWKPLVEMTRWRHVQYRKHLARQEAAVGAPGQIVSAGV